MLKKGLHFSFLQLMSRIIFVFDSPQYHTKFEYLGENEAKFENILTNYSVATADSNYEKNRSKILFVCPLKRIRKSHLTPRNIILRGT